MNDCCFVQEYLIKKDPDFLEILFLGDNNNFNNAMISAGRGTEFNTRTTNQKGDLADQVMSFKGSHFYSSSDKDEVVQLRKKMASQSNFVS